MRVRPSNAIHPSEKVLLMRPSQIRNLIVLVVVAVLGLWAITTPPISSSSTTGGKKSGKSSTWISMLWYSIAPVAAARWWRSSRFGWLMRKGWTSPASAPGFPPILPPDYGGAGDCGDLFASASIDYWTVMRFFGSRGAHSAAPRCLEGSGFFASPAVLSFRSAFLFGSARFCICAGDPLRLVFWATARGWQLWLRGGSAGTFDLGPGCCCCRAPAAPALCASSPSFCCWVSLPGFSRQLRSSVQLACLHDRRGLRGCEDYASLALAAHCGNLAALPLSWMSQIQEGSHSVVTFFVLQLAVPGRRRRLCAAE
jgi:hypothetical protein